MKTRAAILAQSRQPLIVDEIDLPDTLDAGQVLVRVLYTSICGAQLNEIDAVKGPDKFLPHLLGHEASGIVEDTGQGVQHVKKGDHVVLHWRPSLGIQAHPAKYLWQGEPLNAGWITTFQEQTIVSENRLTVIPSDFDMKIAPLFGCAVTTALGVVTNDAKIKIGESVVVFGVGGVGLHIVQFAKMAGAYPIVAVDVRRDRLEMAKADESYLFPSFRPGPYDAVIETSGKVSASRAGFCAAKEYGIFVGVGVPEPIPAGNDKDYVHRDRYPDLLGKQALVNNRWITQSHGGDSKPHIDIPRLIRLVEAGRLSLDGIFQHEFPLEQINDAIGAMRKDGGRFLIDLT